MKIALEDADKSLRPIMRSIDKKVDYVAALTEGEKPGIALTISKRERTKVITIPVEALVDVDEDAVKWQGLRHRIKRAYDKMLFTAPPLASTKMVRGSISGDGFFRSSGGPRR